MRKLLILLTSLILASGMVAADNHEAIEAFNETVDLDELEEEINSNQDEIPGFIQTIVGGQNINLHFNNTEYSYSAELDGIEVEELGYEELEDPTLEVWVDPATLESVMTSEDAFDEIQEALDEGGIDYEAHSTRNSIVFTITETILSVTDRLGITS